MFERRDRQTERDGQRLDVNQLHLSERTPDLGKDSAETGKLSTLTNFQGRKVVSPEMPRVVSRNYSQVCKIIIQLYRFEYLPTVPPRSASLERTQVWYLTVLQLLAHNTRAHTLSKRMKEERNNRPPPLQNGSLFGLEVGNAATPTRNCQSLSDPNSLKHRGLAHFFLLVSICGPLKHGSAGSHVWVTKPSVFPVVTVLIRGLPG